MNELPPEWRRFVAETQIGGGSLGIPAQAPVRNVTAPPPQPQAASYSARHVDKKPLPVPSKEAARPLEDKLEIVGYSAWGFHVQIVPAFKRRDWMDAAAHGFPYHCLPMALANLSGWFVLAAHGAVAEWNGGPAPEDLTVRVVGDPVFTHVASAVGSGIVTWTIPYVFRTPPGWNLLCRGPANYVKDGVSPLEGLTETDWSYASFSMNWKLTRPGTVEFKAGEPVAMLVPQRRGDLEAFHPRVADLRQNPELWEGYTTWIHARREFLDAQKRGDIEAIKKRFQKHYFTGQTNEGEAFEPHQKARTVRPFERPLEWDAGLTTAGGTKPADGEPKNEM
jgi:hypothetical protein